MRSEERIALIGMGWIGEHIHPCYAHYLGDNLATNLMAFKRSPHNLEALQARYPFPVLAGNYREPFLGFAPTFIILSTVPTQIRPVTEGILKPYVDGLRAKGQPMPLVLSFAPSPPVQYFREILGEGLDAFTVLPAMETQVNGVDCRALSNTMLTPDPQHPPSEESLRRVTEFLQGLAQVFVVPQADVMAILAGKIAFHMLDLACQDMGQRLLTPGSGTEADEGQQYIGGRMRALFTAQRGMPCAVVPCPAPRPEEQEAEGNLTAIQQRWYEGVLTFLAEKRVEGAQVVRIMDIAFELHLLCLQLESWATILYKLKSHATPGGMTEHAVQAYHMEVQDPLMDFLSAMTGEAGDPVAAGTALQHAVQDLALTVYDKGAALAG